MAASDHLSPGQFYHGSNHEFAPDDLVEPGHSPNIGAGRADRSDHVYVASTPEHASAYGKHTYRVEPTGSVDIDPELVATFGMPSRPELATHWRSSSPMRIVGRV